MGIKCTWTCLLSLFEKLDIAQVDYEMSINLLFSVNSVEKKEIYWCITLFLDREKITMECENSSIDISKN